MVALAGSYNIWIVALSLVIAFFTSYQAFGIFQKISNLPGKIAWGWMIIASVVMGCGIWTMHFIGMTALYLPISLDYDMKQPLLALTISIGASLIAFYLLSVRLNQLRLMMASICITTGIIGMHYYSMSTMENELLSISYEPVRSIFSVLIAFLATLAALTLFVKIKTIGNDIMLRSFSALLMAAAITAAHYVGMEGSTFICADPAYINEHYTNSTPKGLLITLIIVALVIVILTWVMQVWEQIMYKKMAFTDSLTGLNNRHAMNALFKNPFLFQHKFAIMFIDLDHFKYINDSLGHDVGDLLIQEMGARFKKHVSGSQQVFRIGGDEFMIMMPYDNKSDVLKAVEKLLQDIRRPFSLGNHQLEVTGSIGISYSIEHGSSKDSLLKSADTAMYNAKNLGKNQFCEYDDEMEQKTIRRTEIEKGLREALTSDQLKLHYQPKWDVSVNRPIGFEALLRYNHPLLGSITPGEFIPIAEESGLILQLTEWVLLNACRDCHEWNKKFAGGLVVSVNLSSKVIESNMLQELIDRAITETGLTPSLLELEITEQAMIYCGSNISNQLQPLQQLGVKLSMDNFGSGYSFLGSLEQLQFQTIKIDRAYIENYDLPTKRAIVNSVISLANQLEVQLIAEGVETEPQLKFMQEAGCTVMQGYYFKKPMPGDEVEKWLRQL